MTAFKWLGGQVWQMSLASSMLLLASCSVYLHDDHLQKQTDNVLSTYKSADVVGSVKSALDAQSQLDQAELQSVADKESADRERAVADLISPYPARRNPPQLQFAINRLNFRVDDRIKYIVGTGKFDPLEWLDLREKLVDTSSVSDDLQRQLIKQQRAYADAGGTNFTSCDRFSGPDGVPETLQSAAKQLKQECDIVTSATQPLSSLRKPIDDALNADGKIALVHSELVDVNSEIDAETMDKNDALKKLQTAQQAVQNATKDPNATSTDVNNQLENLDRVLKDVDARAGFLGGKKFSPGTALAAIQFRKTNLRDALAAGDSSNGSTAGSPASDANRAIVGVIAGLIQVSDVSKNPPSVPALSVALAYQDGLEKTVQAQLDALTQKKSLLQDEQDSLQRELEFLAVAKVAGQTATGPLTSKSCRPLGFADAFPNAHCTSVGTAAAARALVAYNLSWASGRTAAQLDDREVTQQITWEQLRAAQEAAIARVNMQTIALTEVAAFGQGGIKPETIAAFLQALGVAAIAGGVY